MATDLQKSVFWETQPVGIASSEAIGIIDVHVALSHEPVLLPDGLVWRDVPPEKENMLRLEAFLANHYITDQEEGTFRLGYSADFLLSFVREGEPGWSLSVVDEAGDMVGYITAVKKKVSLMRKEPEMIAEVNLLCVRQDERGKALASILIKEVTRRVNLSGICVAIFTSGRRLPNKPFTSAKFYHKFLNVKVLNEIGFTKFVSAEELEAAKKQWQHKHIVPRINGNVSRVHILRTCSLQDVQHIVQLFSSEWSLYAVVEIMDEQRLKGMMEKDYLQCFVVEELELIGFARERKVVGFVSVFDTDLIVLEGGKIKDRVPTSYIHYQAGVVSPAVGQLFTLLQKQGKCVVSAVSVASNMAMIKQEKMLVGTGELFYHMYNYRLPIMQPCQVNYHVY